MNNVEMRKIKHLYNFEVGFTPDTNNPKYYSKDDNGYKWVNVSDLNDYVLYDTSNKLTFDGVIGRKPAPKGSLMYSFKLSVGKVSFCNEDMFTNEAIASFVPNSRNSLRYLYYAAPEFIVLNAYENIYGAKILNQDLIKNAKIPYYTFEKQEQIADYLDHKVHLIDLAIKNSEKEIVKLQSYKESIIQNKIKSIEDNSLVPLKVLVICNDKSLSEKTSPSFEFDYIDIGSVEYGKGIISKEKMMFSESPSRARRLVEKDDIIISTVRTYLKSIAFIDEINSSSVVSTGFAVLKCKDKTKLNPRYLYYVMQSSSFLNSVSIESVGVSYPAINSSNLLKLKVPYVSFSEQAEIVRYLDLKCEIIDKLIETKTKKIELLKEYKQSFIHECITGRRVIPCQMN